MDEQHGRRPVFGVFATIVIAAALLLPFMVWKLTDAEPFPAIILPGSPSSVDVSADATTFVSLNLVAFDAGGAEQRLDPRDFLDPIPVQFLGVLAGEKFGQARRDEQLRIKFVGITVDIDGHHASDEEQRAARRWMADQLDELGFAADRLLIRYDRVTYDITNGREQSREPIDETVIDLD